MTGTVRITVNDLNGTKQKYIVGTSYKPWWSQATEFIYRRFGSKTEGWRYKDVDSILVRVERSSSPFVGGSLKWCHEDIYQEELNDEARRPSEPARKYKDMNFEMWPAGKATLTKKLKEY